MVDDMWDRQYRSSLAKHEGRISGRFHALTEALSKTFRVGHAIQFDAPWSASSKDAGCA